MQKWILLKGLRMDVSIGIHEFERAAPQPYKIDIALKLCDEYKTCSDDISETVDYDRLHTQVKGYLASRHFNLQETVIQDVVDICFVLDGRIVAVDVATAKTDVYPDCDAVGLHYILARDEWMHPK